MVWTFKRNCVWQNGMVDSFNDVLWVWQIDLGDLCACSKKLMSLPLQGVIWNPCQISLWEYWPHGFSKFKGWKRYAFHAILWLEYISKFWEENYKFLDIWLASPFHHWYGACIWWSLYWDLFLFELVSLIWHIYNIISFFIITLMSYGAFNLVNGL